MANEKSLLAGMTEAERRAHYEQMGGLQHSEPRKPTPEEMRGMTQEERYLLHEQGESCPQMSERRNGYFSSQFRWR